MASKQVINPLTNQCPPPSKAISQADLEDKIDFYLKQSYVRTITPESDGSYRGEILEFTGCVALGDTIIEAFENLEAVAVAWLEAALDHNQSIPSPRTSPSLSAEKNAIDDAQSMPRKAVQNGRMAELSAEALAVAKSFDDFAAAAVKRERERIYERLRSMFLASYAEVLAIQMGIKWER